MPEIKLWYPISAAAEFSFEKPASWENLTEVEQEEYAFDKMRPVGYLCHHCSTHLETDFEPLFTQGNQYFEMEFYD